MSMCICLDDGTPCQKRRSKARGANPLYCWKHQKCTVNSAGAVKQDKELQEAIRLSKQEANRKLQQENEKQRFRQEAEIREAIRLSKQEANRKLQQENEKQRLRQEAELKEAVRLSTLEAEAKSKPQQELSQEMELEEAIKLSKIGSHIEQPVVAKQHHEDVIRERPVRSQRFRMPCADLGGFKNANNSCYLDSLLYAILHMPNQFIDNYILFANLDNIIIYWKRENRQIHLIEYPQVYELTLLIQQLLLEAINTIYTGHKLIYDSLREAFQEYDRIIGSIGETINWVSSQLSPFDVMIQLSRIFMIPETTVFTTTHIDLNPIDFSEEAIGQPNERILSCIIDIHQNMISDYNEIRHIFTDKPDAIPLNTLINTREMGFKNNLPYASVTRLISSPLLYVHLNRIAGQNIRTTPYLRKNVRPIVITEKKIGTAVFPDEIIQLDSGQRMRLVSIIVHWGTAHGGHYVTYIVCENEWYLYNDIGFNKLKKIGSFDQLFNVRRGEESIARNATDFIYI